MSLIWEKNKKNKKSKGVYIYNILYSNIIEEIRKINNGRRPLALPKNKKRLQGKIIKFSWDKIKNDKRGNPKISFDLSNEEREKIISVLDLSLRSMAKKELLKKLSSEFIRSYERYRRALERESGRVAHFFVSSNSEKYAAIAAEKCVRRGITPFELLKYWHENMKNFKDGNIKIPPLTFLSSDTAIDTVCCSNKKESEPYFGNSFAKGKLDINVLKDLRKVGFDIEDIPESFIVQLLEIAKLISEGNDIYVSRENKKLVSYFIKRYF